jgi:hypothetical protein
MMSMMTRFQNSTRVRIATITVAALTLILAAVPPVHATGAGFCGDVTPLRPRAACTEMVWANGVQYSMTFANTQFPLTTNAPTDNFYVIAPQTSTPQGPPTPFPHDHVVGDVPPQNHGDYNVHYHGFLVFCSAQGISSGGCVPTMTSTPFGVVPLAKTVNGQMLTSVEPIESPANSGLITLFDTGADLIGTINPST